MGVGSRRTTSPIFEPPRNTSQPTQSCRKDSPSPRTAWASGIQSDHPLTGSEAVRSGSSRKDTQGRS